MNLSMFISISHWVKIFCYLERFEVEQAVSWSENVDEKVPMERSQLENGTFRCSM